MSWSSPQEAIIQHLPRSQALHEAIFGPASTSIRPETIQFLKAHSVAHYQMHVIQYENQAHEQWLETLLVQEDARHQWEVMGSTVIVDEWNPLRESAPSATHQPRLQLAWEQLPAGPFWARGKVIQNGSEITRVRLQDASGHHFEDTVTNSIVLFAHDTEIRFPLLVQFYNHLDQLVGQETLR
ncbi:hypothetical protein [Dictyobacter formicarum]|uniref:DUF2505 domain-containing protein n=1 Tax=Dictyobacter formicarum TaxID=2778368 RepID=A0ABQ3VKZ0_9CHLR|nr:hypothetical protein [Dictyobacter formicarum]GHO86892.1 hypothetical protein KSZ_48980 [Dictyobacter formicarum]